MSLSDRIRAFVPAVAVVGALAGSPDVRADEAQKQQITEQEKEKLDQNKYELEDGRFLSGDFTKLNPADASINPKSDYYTTFSRITDSLHILAKYGETLPDEYKNFRKGCIDALLKNLFVPNLRFTPVPGFEGKGLNDAVRDLLEREGVLDHDKQLEKLVESAARAYEEAGRVATLSKPEEHEKVVKVVELTQQHVLSLQQQAENSTRLALSLRLQPRTYAPDEMDEKRRDVIHSQQSALEHLVELRRAMDNGDLEKVQENLGAWKEQYQKGQAGMLRLVDMAGANVQFELGKDTEWKQISVGPGHDRYLGSDWATARFAEQWGEKGKNFYGRIDRLRGIQAGLESLGKYLEKNEIIDRPIVLRKDTSTKIIYPNAKIKDIRLGDYEAVVRMLDDHNALLATMGGGGKDDDPHFFLYDVVSHKKEELVGTRLRGYVARSGPTLSPDKTAFAFLVTMTTNPKDIKDANKYYDVIQVYDLNQRTLRTVYTPQNSIDRLLWLSTTELALLEKFRKITILDLNRGATSTTVPLSGSVQTTDGSYITLRGALFDARDGRLLFSDDEGTFLYDTQGKQKDKILDDKQQPSGARISPNGRLVAIEYSQRSLSIMDLLSRSEYKVYEAGGWVDLIGWSNDSWNAYAYLPEEHKLLIVDVQGRARKFSLDLPALQLELSETSGKKEASQASSPLEK